MCKNAEEYSRRLCDQPVTYIPSCNTRKETLAHERQNTLKIEEGLVGVWSCVESCHTYKAAYNASVGHPVLQHAQSQCKHLYFYRDDPNLGFMSVRLQTWLPYEIQIAINGREWLRRMMDKAGIPYFREGNKFLDVGDYAAAQCLLDSQLNARWIDLLDGFVPDAFPSMSELLEGMRYTWTQWQSEWARDYLFADPKALDEQMNPLLRHAFITGTSERVLRYMGKPVRPDGQPHHSANPELLTRVNKWYDGARIRHWLDGNSVKMYNEQNVLRFEFTMNDPSRFRIHRNVEGKPDEPKKFLPMRKGIADITPRAKVSAARVQAFTEQAATLQQDVTVGDVFSQVIQPIIRDGKRYRALEVTGKDLML
jgi:hypothetical protein